MQASFGLQFKQMIERHLQGSLTINWLLANIEELLFLLGVIMAWWFVMCDNGLVVMSKENSLSERDNILKHLQVR